jgi:peptide/nickel transport system permease protein
VFVYAGRRLIAGLFLALLVTFITFTLLSASSDAIVRAILGPESTPELVVQLKADMGLDRPLLVQYGDWLVSALQGDLGRSYFTSELVVPAVVSRLGVTLSVVLVALTLTAIVSVALGVVAAYRGGPIDRVLQGVSLVGHVVPGLLIAIVLVVVFAINLKWLPATGYTAITDNPMAWIRSITLPVATLVVTGVATIAAQVRGAMIDELRKDYVRTLRTRGVPSGSIVLRHALRNAASPALTVFSIEFIGMLGGALIIEKIFALPGYGQFAFSAALQSDIPVIMGTTLYAVMLVVGVNLLVDLLNGWLNPKARTF